MNRSVVAISLGVAMLAAGNSAMAGMNQEYVVFKAPDGSSAMEKAWAVSSRIIVTTPFDTDAYLASEDGVFTGSRAEVKFLARNRGQWLKVYTSDVELQMSGDIPREIMEAFSGLSQAIERAGGLDQFRRNVRPYDGEKRRMGEATVTVAYRREEMI